MERIIVKRVKGSKAIDGAGVHLTRVLGNATVEAFDPILMLDSLTVRIPMTIRRDFPCILTGD